MITNHSLVDENGASYDPRMSNTSSDDGHLTGMLLIAMPTMPDPRFSRSVVYLCSHTTDGAMGIIINHLAENLDFGSVIGQLGIEPEPAVKETPVHVGGPVETSRGFVLHSLDYVQESTMIVDQGFALTATVDVLKAIAEGKGPDKRMFALGYAGWGAGQLDSEIQSNGWLIAPADEDLVFNINDDDKWNAALAKLGVDPALLSVAAGHA